MEILNPQYFHDYLITNEGFSNDFSLYALKNKYPNIELEIFENSEYFHQQELTYKAEDFSWQEEKKTIGSFEYKTSQIDPVTNFEHYVEIFKLQVLGFKDQSEDIQNLMNDFAVGISGRFIETLKVDNKEYTIFFYLGDDSGTATWEEEEAINGARMVRGTLMVLAEVSESIVNSNKIELYSEDYQERVSFNSMKTEVRVEQVRDSSTGSFCYKNENERGNYAFAISGLYLTNKFCRGLYAYNSNPSDKKFRFTTINKDFENYFGESELTEIEEPTGSPVENGWYEFKEDTFIKSQDTSVNSEKTYFSREDLAYKNTMDYVISNLRFTFSYGSPISYEVTFTPAREDDDGEL